MKSIACTRRCSLANRPRKRLRLRLHRLQRNQARLRLHPLAVLITVTTGTLLFGVMGAILAAPLTSAGVNAYHQLRDAGVPAGSQAGS